MLASDEPRAAMRMPRFAADFVNQRAVDQKRQRIDQRADGEDDSEILVGHQRAERVLGDVQIVAPHAEKRVGHAERQPVDEAAHHEPPAVPQRVVAEIKPDDSHQAEANDAVRVMIESIG